MDSKIKKAPSINSKVSGKPEADGRKGSKTAYGLLPIASAIWFFLFIAFFALRLTWLLTSIDSLYWPEEIYRGTLALEWLHGFHLDFMDYLADAYDGGPLWIGTLAVPFFKIFGANLFALKLVSLFLSFLTLIGILLFGLRFFNSRTALWCGLFYVFSPPVSAGLSLYAIGTQPETPFLIILLLGLFYEMLFRGKHQSLAYVFLWGTLSGLAFWYTSTNFIVILTMILSWIWISPKTLSWKKFFVGFLGFLVGVFPQIIYNLNHQSVFLDFLHEAFVSAPAQKSLYPAKLFFIPLRFLRLFLQTVPFSFSFRPLGIFSSLMISLIFYLVMLRIIFPLFKKAAPDRDKPLLFYAPIFLLIYSLSNYGTYFNFSTVFYSYRYFAPLYFFLILLLGISTARYRSLRLWGMALLLLGLTGQLHYLFREPWGVALRYQGASYLDLGRLQAPRFLSSPSKIPAMVALAEKFREPEKHLFYLGIADAAKGGLVGSPETILEFIQKSPAPYRRYFAEGWGAMICDPSKPDFGWIQKISQSLDPESRHYFWYGVSSAFENYEVPDFFNWVQRWPKEYASLFYTQFGQAVYFGLYSHYGDRSLKDAFFAKEELSVDLKKLETLKVYLQNPDASFKTHFVQGMGYGAGMLWSQWGNLGISFAPVTKILTEKEKKDFYFGVGKGLRRDMLLDPVRTQVWISRLPEEFRENARQGAADFETWYKL